jgi:hypothetical protein
MMDNQEASQELLDMQSMNFIFIFVSPYVWSIL